MTEIPGGFPKKVCPETFVSNHTGPIRIAEDQMQRLLRCIVMGRIVRDIEEEEPKPEPDPIPKMDSEAYARSITEHLVRVNMAEPEPEPAPKPEPEPAPKPVPGYVSVQVWSDLWRDYIDLKEELIKAQQENEQFKYRICDLEQEVKFLKSAEDTLKAQVPKERACVVLRPYDKYYEIAMPPIIFRDRESAIKWAEERILEVLE